MELIGVDAEGYGYRSTWKRPEFLTGDIKEMIELKVGDRLYTKIGLSSIMNFVEIYRTTKTQAITEKGIRFNRIQPNTKFIQEIGPKRNFSVVYELENEDLLKKYTKFNMLQAIKYTKFDELSDDKLEKIIKIINDK